MSAEAIESPLGDVSHAFGIEDLKSYVADQMGLHELQRIASLESRFLEIYHDGNLLSRGVRLTCAVLGSEQNGGNRTFDIFEGEGMDDHPAFSFAKELAGTPEHQRFVTWVGYVGVERKVFEPLPTIKQYNSLPRSGW